MNAINVALIHGHLPCDNLEVMVMPSLTQFAQNIERMIVALQEQPVCSVDRADETRNFDVA